MGERVCGRVCGAIDAFLAEQVVFMLRGEDIRHRPS
jgi:hypothetical protein